MLHKKKEERVKLLRFGIARASEAHFLGELELWRHGRVPRGIHIAETDEDWSHGKVPGRVHFWNRDSKTGTFYNARIITTQGVV